MLFSRRLARRTTALGLASTALYATTGPPRQQQRRQLPDGLPRGCCVGASGVSVCAPAAGAGEGERIQDRMKRIQRIQRIKSGASPSYTSPLPRLALSSGAELSSAGGADLVARLRGIVGAEHVHAEADAAQPFYLRGARLGAGAALAVVRPGTLQEAVDALQAVAAAGAVVVPQGANTGLTGGSVPKASPEDYGGRECVVLNMRRIDGIRTLREGAACGGDCNGDCCNGDLDCNNGDCNNGDCNNGNIRYLCLAGAGIHTLSCLAKDQGRESHSILGSTFLNPTVAAGVAFGSGGTQMRKGPVFTERALWASVSDSGEVELHDTTGLGLLATEDGAAGADAGAASDAAGAASDADRYRASICRYDEPTVARFNADTTGIDPVRSEGKVLILASVHDSFPAPLRTQLFWVSCDSLETAQRLKQQVCLADADDLPVACEYMDRDAIDVVDEAGRVLCHLLLRLGIGPSTMTLWDAKLWIEAHGARTVPDLCLHYANSLLPPILPAPIAEMSRAHDHHLLITVGEFGGGEMERAEARLEAFVAAEKTNGSDGGGSVVVHSCGDDADTVQRVGVFRFAAAPAFRTWCVGRGLQGLSLDYALPKNNMHVPEIIGRGGAGEEVGQGGGGDLSVVRMRYSHFGCNVVHEDIAYPPGVDVHACKMAIKKRVEEEGGRLPAEHGHGTEYAAPVETEQRWRRMDPTNTMNPGVGRMDARRWYGEQ
jgi:D-lactate dehydrogenase (quinone)